MINGSSHDRHAKIFTHAISKNNPTELFTVRRINVAYSNINLEISLQYRKVAVLMPWFTEAKSLSLWETHLLSQSLRHQSQCNTKDDLISLTYAVWETQIDWQSEHRMFFFTLHLWVAHSVHAIVFCVLWPIFSVIFFVTEIMKNCIWNAALH